MAVIRCHLHPLNDDKLHPAELKELLSPRSHGHQLNCTCVFMCSCVCVSDALFVFILRHICRGIDTLCEQRFFNKAVLTESTRKPNFLSPLHVSFSASVHRFSVNVEPGTKLESGAASLHLCNNLLVLTRGVPPVVIGHWKLSALRRYGAVPNGFVFEGGTRCGYCE